MSCKYWFDTELNCTLVRYEGAIEVAEITRLFETMVSDKKVVVGSPRLTDIRRASFDVTGDDTRQIAAIINQFDEVLLPSRAAIVATEGNLFGLSRQFLTHRDSEDDKFAAFTNIAGALEWVGLSRDLPDPFDGPQP